MVYDVFDIRKYSPHRFCRSSISLYHAHMRQGVVTIPPYESAGGPEAGGGNGMLKALADYALSRHLVSSRPGYRYKSLRAYIHLTPEGRVPRAAASTAALRPFGKASRRGTLPRYRADGGGTQMQRPSGRPLPSCSA